VHRAVDDHESDPRMIVLGGWQNRSSFLKIDPSGATFTVLSDEDAEPSPAVAAHEPLTPQPRLPTS
jgi:hypothetical protein